MVLARPWRVRGVSAPGGAVIVRVAGLERFLGDVKRCYRGIVRSDDPEPHHAAFAENIQNATLVDSGIGGPQNELVAKWEADPRTLVADMIDLGNNLVSYRLYEVKL